MTSLDTNQPLSQNKSSKIYSPRLQQLRDSIVQSKAKIKTKTESKSELPYLNVS